MLAVEHRLDLIVVERGEDAVDIVAEAGGDADRLLVAAEGLGVEQSGIELVLVVERHLATVVVEDRGADVAAHPLWNEEIAVIVDSAELAGENGELPFAPVLRTPAQLGNGTH